MKFEFEWGVPGRCHQSYILGWFCFRWNKDKLGGNGGGGGQDGCQVLLTRDRNSELGSHQVVFLAEDLHREVGANIGSNKQDRVVEFSRPEYWSG